MDQVKTGKLIRYFRIKINLTQKQLAEKINVTDKAISKWENGKGYPDISLLTKLAEIFNIDVQVLLSGEIEQKEKEIGNMKNLKFYVCGNCGNIITSTSESNVFCCGEKLLPLTPKKADEKEMLSVENIGSEFYITSDHTMTKEHYISFVAYVNESTSMIFKQYPEWNLQLYLPLYRLGRLVWYCNKCGLFYQDIK